MILLSGHSLQRARKIPLESMQLTLKERESTATIVPADMDGIGVNSWLMDDTEPGEGIVWRVKSIAQAYATRTPTVQLEHMINSLRDQIMFGEITPATITGNSNATSCTADQAIRYILSYQSDWVLDRFEYAGTSNPYKFDGDTLFDALETVSNSLRDSWWTYDMSVYPFRLNIIYKPNATGTEMRAGRNLKTITRTIDKSGMYTRFYPIGKEDLHISGNYVEKNTGAYGVVSKVETDESIDTEAELRRLANERLAAHAEPTVTIDVEGIELVKETGVSLDRMWLGSYCRVPLPEFGTEITERIVTLTYQDKVNQPEVVKITLANNRTDVTKIIADTIKGGGKKSRTSTKKDKEDHAWMEDTDNHVALCAKGIIGVDAQGNPNWVRLSRLEVNEDGIYGEVKSVQGDMVIAQTRIDMNENAITLEAQRATSAEGTLSGKITVEAGKISQIVSAVGADGEVTAASIVLAINEAGESEARIDANKVYIGNSKSTTVINGKLNASDFTADSISAKLATLAQVVVNGMNVIGDVYVRNGAGSQQNVSAAIWDIQLTGPVNGVYTLKRRRINEADYTDIGTFSRATSLSGQWSGGELTVTASPQGNTFRADLFTGGHWGYASGEDTKTYYGSISAKHNGGSTSYSTGEYFEVDASSIYDDGYDAGYDLGLDDGWYAYYDSGQWEAPSASNGWKAKIPTRASSSKNETWLTLTSYSQWHPNSLSMYCTEGGQVPGTSIFRYKFTVEASSDWGYVSGKSYPFYY